MNDELIVATKTAHLHKIYTHALCNHQYYLPLTQTTTSTNKLTNRL